VTAETPAAVALHFRTLAARLDAMIRDERWKETPIGREVGRFLSYLQAVRDASPRTVDDYGRLLGRFAVEHADLTLKDFEGAAGAERLLDWVGRRWREAQPATRRVVLSVLASFFAWAERFEVVDKSPMRLIDRPRRRRVERYAHPMETVWRLINAQERRRDRVALMLLGLQALRKNELRLLRWRDLDLAGGRARIAAKGGHVHLVPLLPVVRREIAALALEEKPRPEHYLLYPERVGNAGKPHLRGIVRRHPERPMQPSTMHRWFKRCLQAAGLPDMPMHELRHSAGDAFRRATGDLELTRVFLRHASISTTSAYYMHAGEEELQHAFASLPWGETK
jgi:integrase